MKLEARLVGKKHTPDIRSDYLNKYLVPANIKLFVKRSKNILKNVPFDGFAFRGVSGALLAPPLAYALNKTLIVVRKPKYQFMEGGESTHSYMPVEGDKAIRRYIIVDDFVCTGATVRDIVQGISEFSPDAICVGLIKANDIIIQRTPKLANILDHLPPELRKFGAKP